jgi:HAD superfamily hydrolase (TIGR01490 family)
MATARPFAVFDIDGTLIRWQLYHALADEMVRRNLIDPIQFQNVKAARMDWKKREASFTAYEQTLIALIDVGLKSISPKELQAAAQAVIEVYKDQTYTYTRDLIKELKAKNYLLFAISGSHAEIVRMLADHHGFDDFGGSRYEVKAGKYTGHKDLMWRERKPEYLKGLVKKHNATLKGSMALGDSEGDIDMLAFVSYPIAFNPSRELFEHAQKAGWNVVVERKNMIYKLEAHDGGYRYIP